MQLTERYHGRFSGNFRQSATNGVKQEWGQVSLTVINVFTVEEHVPNRLRLARFLKLVPHPVVSRKQASEIVIAAAIVGDGKFKHIGISHGWRPRISIYEDFGTEYSIVFEIVDYGNLVKVDKNSGVVTLFETFGRTSTE